MTDQGIHFYGKVKLVEKQESRDTINYCAVLNLHALGVGCEPNHDYELPEVSVPITESTYNSLKKQLESSKAEEVHIEIEGTLEMVVKSVCIN